VTAGFDGLTEGDNVKIVQINDCDWWIGESLEACVQDYRENVDDAPEYTGDARELTDAELDKVMFNDEDGSKRTFREQLAVDVAEGGKFPRLFASTEY
jgi:hypothetical protein